MLPMFPPSTSRRTTAHYGYPPEAARFLPFRTLNYALRVEEDVPLYLNHYRKGVRYVD